MNIVGPLVLLIVMYIVVPIAICAATIAALGGTERFLPGGLQGRAAAGRDQGTDHH